MSQNGHTSMKDVREKIRYYRDGLGLAWPKIAAKGEFNQNGQTSSEATLWRIYRENHEPTKPETRAALGLPALVPVAPCSECGVVHKQVRTCARERKKNRRRRRGMKRVAPYVTPEQKEAIEEQASSFGMNVSDYIRAIADGDLKVVDNHNK